MTRLLHSILMNLKIRLLTSLPALFYLFGWAFPPSDKFGEKPYPGEYPYEGADRSKLRPEYKKAYQLVLKTFWDHLKEKGWADRFILYLSDEPHEADKNNGKSDDIKIQMKALCDMIHEVDPRNSGLCEYLVVQT